MVKLTDEQVNEIVADLVGTTKGLDEVLQEVLNDEEVHLEDIDSSSLGEIDQVIFQCVSCMWWCEQSEMTENPEADDEWICTDCIPNEDEEEE